MHAGRIIERASAAGRVAREYIGVDPKALDALAQALRRRIDGEVRFEIGDRALYATDASNYRQVPLGVVVPKTVDDVVAAVALCREHDVPIVPRGGGTSLGGQGCNSAVLVDFSKYLNRVLEIDAGRRLAVAEPGCVLDTLRDAAEGRHLTFGPDPSTHDRNTLGGMIGNDSCGAHSVMAGRTADNVHELDIVTYDGVRMSVGATPAAELEPILRENTRRGAIYRGMRELWQRYGAQFMRTYPQIPRRVSGFENLDQLAPEKSFHVARALVGTEANCAIVLKATVNLVPSPPERVLAIVGAPDVYIAADQVPDVLALGPIALEGIDELLVDYMHQEHFRVHDLSVLPEGEGWLIAEFGGNTREEATERARRCAACMRQKGFDTSVVTDTSQQKQVWEVREAGLAVTAHVPGEGNTWPGWEDSAVRREDLGRYLRDLKALFRRHGYHASVYGHFGDGLVHCRVDFDLSSERGLRNWQAFLEEAADLVVSYGGSLSGEHGDGQARGALLEKMYGRELMEAQRAFKQLWDPRGRMNPGKVIDPYPPVSNLRVGPEYRPPEIKGYFALREDGGSFTRATMRCVGVGKCRRHGEGVMCPSYMGTLEEKHSTRGRARLLFEMLHGGAITDLWRSKAVAEALELCLACKGCKRDCPVQVDMATYKAEFYARHYAQRLRPRAAYSMGQIMRWARAGGAAPRLANFLATAPGISAVTKYIGGIAQGRTLPAFASPTFRRWHARHAGRRAGERIVLWPDTFNNYFRAETAIAATRYLEQLGFQVAIPKKSLCCGRPLYDWGWIAQAKNLWRETLDTLGADIEQGVPVVGLEPSCVAAFRDELPGLFPDDPHARALSRQTRLLSEFLHDRQLDAPQIAGKLLVQFHCHHHAVLDLEAERRLLRHTDAEFLAAGCCGMAGAFGFDRTKYELSLRIGERALFPAIRSAPPNATVVANGFSCREQIEHATGRATLHLAELLARSAGVL